MARVGNYKSQPKPGGVLRGKPDIAEYMGCATKTLDRWFKQEAFPLGKMPNGDWVSTVTLIDTWIQARGILWLKSRMKHRPKTLPMSTAVNANHPVYAAMGMQSPADD